MNVRPVVMVLALLAAGSACARSESESSAPMRGTATKVPAGAPTASTFTCDDAQFLTDQRAFASGALHGDQLVDICGSVARVLGAKHTASGAHGYFYLSLPSGAQIEIVSNLDAMADAPTGTPPTTWPWVAAGNYVYVEGRYYYDSAGSQGVDWTEDDTARGWPHTGYVIVCSATRANCSKYW